ncbi:14321_t:CDS:1 [Funneliformis geosporum]|nr:14321_t:CDS:1 [Funneliformis geosporum]
MAFYLPRECLEEIFHILEYDKSTLYSCLLVNRFWCSSVVKFLWKQPFQLVKRPNPSLIEIYTSSFSHATKTYLLSEGVYISSINEPKVFDYSSFVRGFRFEDLYESTSLWLQEGYEKGRQIRREPEVIDEKRYDSIVFDDLRIVKLVVHELVKLFFSKIRVLDFLSLNTQRLIGLIDRRFWTHHPGDVQYTPTSFEEFRNSYGFDDLLNIPSYPGANDCLRYLQKFEYGGGSTDGRIMQVLSEISKNLNTLEINFSSWQGKYPDPQMILSLLKAQHLLRRVILRRGTSNCLQALIEGLHSQTSSLNYLEFSGTDFRGHVCLTPVAACVNLQVLVFDRCLGLNNDTVEPLSFATFKKLKKFVFRKSVGFRDLRSNHVIPQSVVHIIGNHNTGNTIRTTLIRNVSMGNHSLGNLSIGNLSMRNSSTGNSSNSSTNNCPSSFNHPLSKMIQNTCGSLKDIRLGRKVWNVRRPPGSIARGSGDFPPSSVLLTISISCPHLNLIETHISRDILPHFLSLLETCQSLQQLHISIGTELMDDEQFWRDLSRKLPQRLKNLMIVIEGTFWLMVVHWLLENCKAPLEILQFPRSGCIDDEYLSLITQYASRLRTLKRLALAKRTKVTNEGLRKALVIFDDISRNGELSIEYEII